MIVNITNPQAIGEWLQEMSAGDDDIACWLQKAFSKALKKREESAAPLQEWPENPPAWMKPDGSYHEFYPDPELKQKVSHIKDWLVAARRHDPAFVENLYPMDLTSAFNKAEKYFTRINQQNQAIIEDDADTTTIVRFDNGARIVQLMTLEALKYEGAQMGHCIGTGSYDEAFSSGREVFYSLRDAKNEPHVTMEVVVEGSILRQCKGKANKPPVGKYMPMLQQFLTQQQFKLKEGAAYCGLVQDTDGQYHSIHNLPENLCVAGDLDLHGCTWLTQLPKNLSVGGRINLEGSTGLTRLTDDLSFTGSLDLTECTSLTQLPKNLSVGGGLYLRDCTSLTQLPENLSVRGSLNLAGCTALTQLPENLSVGGDIDLSQCASITSIPRGLKCRVKIYTDIGTFNTVTEAADAFDRKYRPGQPRARSRSMAI